MRNAVFRGAAVLLAAIIGLAVADNARPWRRLQLEFFELERGQLQSRLEATRVAAAETLADLEARIDAQEARLDGRRDEIAQLEDDLKRFGGKSRAAVLRRQRLESEIARARHRDPSGEQIAKLTANLRQARIEIESFAELIADRERKLAAVRSDLEQARAALVKATSPIDQLEVRLAALPARPLLPLGGLLAPGVAVREVSLPPSLAPGAGIRGAERVDRCVTCHLAAHREDVESDDWPAPFRRHPAPELFPGAAAPGADAPHPYERFGCTSCHGGDGRATDFTRAGHLPVSAEQAGEWRRRRDWRGSGLQPMLPLDLTAAACGRCHAAEVPTPWARSLESGRRLIAALGCTACHADDRGPPETSPGIGPSLVGIAGKTTPAWTHRWLEAPRTFRATRMPHVFDRGEAAAGAPARRERAAEIRAVVDYLWQVSRPAAYEPPPPGEVEAGRALFESVGCRGCHQLGLDADLPVSSEQRHGPHLAGTGSKVQAGWLFAWLRDPRAYRHDTPMPSLRLDEREAADLTAYLMTRRDPAWERLSRPEIDAETRDRLVLESLARGDTIEHSQARFERMSERDKNLYLGERTIARYGCHGCHQIPGFEQTAAAAAPALRELGRELRDGLASVKVSASATGGRWQPASHRPAYDLGDDEARSVTVALLGLVDASPSPVVAAEAATAADVPASGGRAEDLARGRGIVARYNCRGCHRIEGRGGFPRPEAPADGGAGDDLTPSRFPPDLDHAGARLKASWIYQYLADPGRTAVRPWLETRMPTFGLSAAERNALVRYFAVLDDRPLWVDEPAAPQPAAGVAVGRAVFSMLQCGDCHRPASEESFLPQLAPAYDRASQRLRPDWVVSLILDPERWLPGTPMPANFRPGDDGEPGSDFLIGSIHTPIFAVERERLLRLLGSEEALHAYLSDPNQVAEALKDYLWTLGK